MHHHTLIARVAHEVNRGYCIALGDHSVPSWDAAPAWQRATVINGVAAHLKADLTPEQSHESWMAEKQAAGWVWGPFKDPEAKVHPCVTEYANLPLVHRTKDYLFKAVVEAFKGDAKADAPPNEQSEVYPSFEPTMGEIDSGCRLN